MKKLMTIGLAIALATGLYVTAFTASDPADVCTAAKLKAATKKMSDKGKCHGTAIKKGVAVDPACLTKAEDKFEAAFAKAEAKGGCITTGDVAGVESFIDASLVTLLDQLIQETNCTDGEDNDGDGDTDCADSDCAGDATCVPFESDCLDLIDNDGDGDVDCFDTDCVTNPETASDCLVEQFCADAFDNDADGATDCNDSDCAVACPEAICDDLVDNDGDGSTDCDDSDCAPDPVCAP